MAYRVHEYAGDRRVQCTECGGFERKHNAGCRSLRPFPIQGGGAVPWWLAEIAYEYYHEQWPGQSLERLAERGGFGVGELVCFIRKNEDWSWLKPTADELRKLNDRERSKPSREAHID